MKYFQFFVLFTILLVTFNPLALGANINVPADYPTIQAAFDAATDGDIVFVADGVYSGDIQIHGKSIFLQGSDSTVIDCQNSSGAFSCEDGADLSVDNVRIVNGSSSEGVIFVDRSSLQATRLEMIGNLGDGVVAYHESTVNLMNCSFYDNVGDSIVLAESTAELNFLTVSRNAGRTLWIQNSDQDISVINSIFWNEGSDDEIHVISGHPPVTSYSCVRGGFTGNNNIDSDPLFEEEGVSLTLESPCIDSGSKNSYGNLFRDLHGRVYRMRHLFTTLGRDADINTVDMGFHRLEIHKGDVDYYQGITIRDAILAFRIALGMIKVDYPQEIAADWNQDGEVTFGDVQKIFEEALIRLSKLEFLLKAFF